MVELKLGCRLRLWLYAGIGPFRRCGNSHLSQPMFIFQGSGPFKVPEDEKRNTDTLESFRLTGETRSKEESFYPSCQGRYACRVPVTSLSLNHRHFLQDIPHSTTCVRVRPRVPLPKQDSDLSLYLVPYRTRTVDGILVSVDLFNGTS